MCCFSTKTTVHGTTIFARASKPGTQVIAYQMRYAAEAPTAMILPLPVALPAREDAVRFKSLKEFPDFFAALDRGYPAPPPDELVKSAALAAAPALAVHEVGDYIASFVPTIADFKRVDPRFVLSKEVWEKIPGYDDYGFAVFQLKELAGTPHPMAFEFDTRLKDSIFFPTVHIHDGTVHETADFDHVLYAQAASYDARAGDYEGPESVDKGTGFVRSKGKAKDFAEPGRSVGLVEPELMVHKVSMRGLLPNRDTMKPLALSGASRGCSRCDAAPATLRSAPIEVGLTVAGLAWVIRRRDALRKP
jgi:hypothetical protein